LETQYFKAYGIPKSVVTDNAKVFKSKLMYDFCFRWGIKHIFTTPYYAQGSLVERVMRNLKAALQIFHHQSHVRWDENLHLLTFAFNTAHHESTQTTPSLLFLGRELKTPLENVWELEEVNQLKDDRARKVFWEKTIRNLNLARSRVARRYNQGRKQSEYQVGDWVTYQRHTLSSKGKGVSQKLELRWSRPVVIARFLKPNVVQLAMPDTGVIVKKAHLSQIKRYHGEREVV
jgi:hypothetical protein